MGNGFKTWRLKRGIAIGIVVISILAFIGDGIISDTKAKRTYCNGSFQGKISRIKPVSRGQTSVLIEGENEWDLLGRYYDKSILNIEIGDTIIKDAGSVCLYILKDNIKVNITNEYYRDFNCK